MIYFICDCLFAYCLWATSLKEGSGFAAMECQSDLAPRAWPPGTGLQLKRGDSVPLSHTQTQQVGNRQLAIGNGLHMYMDNNW